MDSWAIYSNLPVQNTFRVEREGELKGLEFPFESPSTNLQSPQKMISYPYSEITISRILDFSLTLPITSNQK